MVKNFTSIEAIAFIFFLSFETSLPYKRTGRASALYAFIFENIWNRFGLKVFFRIPDI
jgi:hypothetical protein